MNILNPVMSHSRPLLIGCLVVLLSCIVGCDDVDRTSVLTVTHFRGNNEIRGAIEMEGAGAVVVKASFPEGEGGEAEDALLLPLEWSVHNPGLGGMMRSAGHTAVYESNGRRGQNVIFVKDRQGREGVLAVNQF